MSLPVSTLSSLEGTPRPAPRARRRPGRPFFSFARTDFDAVRVSAAIFVIVTLTAVHMYLGPLRYTRPSFSLLILVGGLIVLKPKTVRWANLREAWPAKAVGLFFVLALGSGLFGLSLGSSAKYVIELYWKVMVFFLVLTLAIRQVRDLAMLVWSYVLSCGILVVLSLTVLEMEATREGLGRLSGQGMFDANDIGMVMLMGIPLALLVSFNSSRLGRVVAIAVLLGTPITIALTGSRGALVGLAVMAPALFFALSRISLGKRLGSVITVLVVLAAAAPAGYWKQMGTIFDTEQNYNYSTDYGRIGIAKRGLGYMMRYPLFGVGIANFPRAEGTISPIARQREMAGMSVEWIAPHNTYVQVGAEMGLPALLLWLGMLWGGSLGLLALRRRLPRRWEQESAERRFIRDSCLFLPLSFLAFAVTSFFLTHAYTTPIYILLAMTAGVVAQARRELKRDRLERAHASLGPA